MELRYHYLRDMVHKGILELIKVATEDNVADVFTKPLAKRLFRKHKRKLLIEDEVDVK